MQLSMIAGWSRTCGLLAATSAGMIACGAVKSYSTNIENFPLQLPPGVSSDPATFRQAVSSRMPGQSHTAIRKGKNCGGCPVNVEIEAWGDTREVDPSPWSNPPLPPTGRAVARIINHDPVHSEEMYGFHPGAEREYYVWADTSGGTARMTILSVPQPGVLGSVVATFQKHLLICQDGHGPPKSSDADFKWCPGVTLASARYSSASIGGYSPLAALSSLVRFLRHASTTLEAPIWLGCHSGCCG